MANCMDSTINSQTPSSVPTVPCIFWPLLGPGWFVRAILLLDGLPWLSHLSSQHWWKRWALRCYGLSISQFLDYTASIPILCILDCVLSWQVLISCFLMIAWCTTQSTLVGVITHASMSCSGATHGPTDAPIGTNACLVSLVAGSCSLWCAWKIAHSVSTNICAEAFNYMLVFVCTSGITMAASDGIDTATIIRACNYVRLVFLVSGKEVKF